MRPRVKICCISSVAEAQLAVRLGADALGLVGEMPSGPGVIGDELIREIAAVAPPPVDTFLLTSRTAVRDIIDHHRAVYTRTLQLVDALSDGTYQELREALPGIKLVQVVHVVDEQSVEAALDLAHHVDALLLDSGRPDLPVKELGGTGRTHNWALSRQICEQAKRPVFLAGGLRPDNVQRALEEVKPYGLDLCSGVRTNGQLDAGKLSAFMAAVHQSVTFVL